MTRKYMDFVGPCTDTASLAQKVNACIEDVARWMQANRLQLNPTKTEVLRCAPPRCQNVIPSGPVCINSTSVLPVTSVRDLGVYIDTDVAMKTHVTTLSVAASQPCAKSAAYVALCRVRPW